MTMGIRDAESDAAAYFHHLPSLSIQHPLPMTSQSRRRCHLPPARVFIWLLLIGANANTPRVVIASGNNQPRRRRRRPSWQPLQIQIQHSISKISSKNDITPCCGFALSNTVETNIWRSSSLRFHHRCHRRRRLQLPVHFNFDKKLSTWYGIIQHHNEFTQDEKEDELKNYSSEPTIIPSIFTQQEQRQQRQQQSCDSTHYIDDEVTQPHPQQEQQSYMTLPRRQFLIASSTIFLATQFQFPTSSNAAIAASSSLTEKVNFQQSPINKRNGITLAEPERIYPLSFITYLSRFLLVFDDQCQTWWYTQARAIPAKSSKEEVERIRLSQFGEFAASVEVGLIDFEGGGGADDGGGSDARAGVEKLLNSLVKRYGPSSLPVARENDPSAANDSSTSSAASSSSSTTTAATATTKGPTEREIIKSKEALRQIALLFSLLEEYQPVEAITRLLAADDDAKIIDVEILDGGAGYYPPSTTSYPSVTFPDPPTLGTEFGGSIAKGVAVMKPSGRLLTIELTYGGSGYVTTPLVDISYPIVTTIGVDGGGNNTNSNDTNDTQVERVQATARAILGKKTSKGRIVDRIELLTPGMGYNISDGITVTISPPGSLEGETATARAILEYEVSGIEIVDKGSGYAAERPINVVIDPPPAISSTSVVKPRSAFAVSYPKGKSTSYGSFIDPRSASVISASISNVDTSQWIAGPTSSQLTALLPSGFGLQYDETLQRYILSRYSSTNDWNDILSGSLEGKKLKPVNPIFGFRGRSPIEKEKTLDLSKVVRFMASGGICSSVAHLILTPIDVVKTKVQTRPEVYNDGIIGTFTKVLNEEGVETFFDGWEPTVVGFFFSGAFGFFLTEYFRRYYTSLVTSIITMPEVGASTVISSLEIPLIVASAATSGFFCCFVLAPFDAVRIRTVSQPDYAENIFGVVTRMVKEEGLSSLFSAVPVWFVKEIPYNVFKFLVFDTSTEFMYEAYPAAREDIRLSLLVSLFGGTLGGIAATIVSNPADVVVSELKKSKTEMSAWEAVERIKDRAGIAAFAKGISLRMIFYSLLVSLQFFFYDTVRIALGVGSDDMKLYLNVLNVALNEKVKQ